MSSRSVTIIIVRVRLRVVGTSTQSISIIDHTDGSEIVQIQVVLHPLYF
jgi:hypothetical protein